MAKRERSAQTPALSTLIHKYGYVQWACHEDIFVASLQPGRLHMPRKRPYAIVLTDTEKTELTARANRYTLPYFAVLRAKMILLAAQGFSNDEIAHRLDTPRKVVGMWRKRFFEERLLGLEERPRPGRPRIFSPGDRRAS